MLYLTNCYVIDCVNRDSVMEKVVAISGNKIYQLYDQLPSLRAEDEVIDLNNSYVIPGLWEVHNHPGSLLPDPTNLNMFDTEANRTIRAITNMQDSLMSGLTSLRIIGEAEYIDVAAKEAQEKGQIQLPRLFVAGKCIRITGGHGSCGKVQPLYVKDYMEADGADEVSKAARHNFKMGADYIKMLVTGGVAGDKEDMYESQFTFEEISAAVSVAQKKGSYVAVHAGGAEGVKTAVLAGVASVEHGYYLTEEVVELMVKNNTYFVPTLSVTQNISESGRENWPKHMMDKLISGREAHLNSFKMALEAGVKIANGADVNPINKNGIGEIELLAKSGMDNWDALVSATRTAAELCNQDTLLGTIESGKLADLVVLKKNPLDGIENIRTVKQVFLEGMCLFN